jgi:hypothetical protein
MACIFGLLPSSTISGNQSVISENQNLKNQTTKTHFPDKGESQMKGIEQSSK